MYVISTCIEQVVKVGFSVTFSRTSLLKKQGKRIAKLYKNMALSGTIGKR